MASIPRLMPRSGLRRAALGGALGLVIALLLLLLRGTDLFESLELRLVDVRTRHFASQRSADERIVVVQIEESDIAAVRTKLGVRWPWPLEYNAHLVTVLKDAGAAALMVDVLHLDRGAGPDDVPGTADLPPAERMMREAEAHEADAYGSALRDFGKVALAFELSATPQYDVPARRTAAEGKLPDGGLKHHRPAIARPGAELPVRRVIDGSALLGFANTLPDLDGVVRRAPVLGLWGKRLVLSLPLATAQLATEAGVAEEDGAVRVDTTRQELSGDAAFLINFGRRSYPRIAPLQLLEWAMHREADGSLAPAARRALEGKIVVFGVNAAGLRDVVPTALGGTLDGPVYQATVLDNLLHGDGRLRAPAGVERLVLTLLLLVAGAAGAGLRGRFIPHTGPIALALLHVLFVFMKFEAGTSHDVFTPLLGLLLTWGGTSALRAFTEGRRNRWLESTFGRYMAPSVIDALKKDPALLELGGRERNVSVLFSDVAGFTGISAQIGPTQLVNLLNRYLTGHCAAVLDQAGVVDKFEGDAVMAFFGDPVPQEDHPLRACRTALRVQDELPQLKPLLEELGVEGFDIRVGINTGTAVVGNMGSEQRFDYTCMGDTVNLASRFEGAAKAYGLRILIGADTAREVTPEMLVKPLGGIVVVGREEPVSVYELVAARDGASAELIAHAEAFERSLAAARRGDLIEARRALDEADRLKPGDGPVAWFRDVLAGLGREPWDGITVLTRK